MTEQQEKVIYTVPEVASLLHVNVAYIHRLRKAGLLPFLKIGCYKCRKCALDLFLETYEGQDVDTILIETEQRKELE